MLLGSCTESRSWKHLYSLINTVNDPDLSLRIRIFFYILVSFRKNRLHQDDPHDVMISQEEQNKDPDPVISP